MNRAGDPLAFRVREAAAGFLEWELEGLCKSINFAKKVACNAVIQALTSGGGCEWNTEYEYLRL